MKKFIIIISFLTFLTYSIGSYKSWYFSDNFRLVYFEVGQGDSSLIVTPRGQTILIDGGPDSKVLRGLGRTLPFWLRKIDLMIITHAHEDHITGLVEVSKRYQVKNVLYNNLNFETPTLESLIKNFKEKKIKMIRAEKGMIFNFDSNCFLSVLAASKEAQKDENDYSIVTMFDCLGRRVLSSGDAGVIIEKELLLNKINLKADIYKVSHHGSQSANSQTFLEAVKPKAAIISSGINNTFGHPAELILDRLRLLAVDIYRTDKQGTREFLANDKEIKVKN